MTRPGTWDADMDGDFLLADGWELVHLLRQSADGTFGDPVGPIFALRETLNKKTVAGRMEAADVVWHLDAVGGAAPDGTAVAGVGDDGVTRGDRIRDSSSVLWSVTDPSQAGASDQWRCPGTRVVVGD